ncbi:hypothetical protein ACFX2J_000090 [Malus domestica]
MDRVLEAQAEDEESQELIEAVSRGKKKDLRIWESDGMLMQVSRMYILNIAELKKDILDDAHISAYVMHHRSTKMYHTIKSFYYWPGMKREIAEYTDRQSERTIQTLEDMLRSSVLQFGDVWHKRLHLMEFAYNNSYHYSVGMSPFEALYGKSCRTPLCWSEVGEKALVGPEIVKETTQNIQLSPWKGIVQFGKKGKLSPRYIRPY